MFIYLTPDADTPPGPALPVPAPEPVPDPPGNNTITTTLLSVVDCHKKLTSYLFELPKLGNPPNPG